MKLATLTGYVTLAVTALLFGTAPPCARALAPQEPGGGAGGGDGMPLAFDRATSPMTQELDQGPPAHGPCCEDPVSMTDPDPVNLANGALMLHERDIGIPGLAGLDFSVDRIHGTGNSYDGPLGRRWDSPIFRRLHDSGAGTDVHFFSGHLREDVFAVAAQQGGVTTYTASSGLFFELTREDAGGTVTFDLLDAGGVTQVFELAGDKDGVTWYRLRETVDPNGNSLTYGYDSLGRLVSITDTMGRTAVIDYHSTGAATGRVRSITDATGAVTAYGYDAAGDLSTVTRPPTRSFPGGSVYHYAYDAAGRLVSIREPGKTRPYLVNVYDGLGRVSAQQLGTSAQQTTIDYSGFPLVRVTDRAGAVVDYLMDPSINRVLQKTVHEADGSGLSYTTAYSYDAELHASSETRPNGQIVDRVFDVGNASPRSRANLLMLIRRASAADPAPLVETWTWSLDFNRVLTHVTPRHHAAHGGQPPLTAATRLEYDLRGNLEKVAFPDVTTPSGPQSIDVRFQHDSLGRVTKRIEADGVETDFVYDPVRPRPFPSREIRDAAHANLVTDFEYDDGMRLTRQALSKSCGCGLANETLWTWDERGQLVRWKARVGPGAFRTTTFAWDEAGNLKARRVQDDSPIGDGWETTTWTHDLLDNPITVTRDVDAGSATTTVFGYDLKGRLARLELPEGRILEYGYDARDRLVEYRRVGDPLDPDDDTLVHYVYDGNGRHRRTVDEIGRVVDYVWDGYDRVHQIIDPHLDVLDLGLDEDGNVLAATTLSPTGAVLAAFTLDVDEHDRTTRIERRHVDSSGAPVGDGWYSLSWTYDPMSRVIGITAENGSSRTMTYDTLGRLSTIRDSMGAANGLDFEYGTDGRLHRLLAVEGDETSGTSASRLVAEITSYDDEGRVLEALDAAGRSTLYEWTIRGFVKARVDRRGFRREIVRDERGRVVADIRRISPTGAASPDDVVSTYDLDGLSRVVSVTAENAPYGSAQTTVFGYDALGRRTSIAHADGGVRSFEYDPADRVVAATDPNGTRVAYVWSAVDRLLGLTVAGGPGVGGMTFSTMTYDDLGRVLTAENDEYVVTRTWSSIDCLESEQVAAKDGSFTSLVEATWDEMARLTELRYPLDTASQPRRVSYSRDPIGRLLSVDKTEGAQTRTVAAWTWLGRRPLSITGPGRVSTFAYDGLGLPSVIEHGTGTRTVARFEIGRESDGGIADVTRRYHDAAGVPVPFGPLDGGAHYERDGADRITASFSGLSDADLAAGNWSAALRSKSYGLDRVWNRTHVTTTEAGTTVLEGILANAVNEYLQVGAETAQYDSSGNRTALGSGVTYIFDFANRPVAIQEGAATTTLSYDPFGRRIRTYDGAAAEAERLTYWGWSPIESRRSKGGVTTTRELVYGTSPDDVLEMRDVTGGGRFTFVKDPSGSPAALLDESGQTVESYRYDDFGRRFRADPSTGAILPATAPGVDNPIGFQGRWVIAGDEEHLDFRRRSYIPAWGRFAQRDPLGYPSGRLNSYHFGHHNPFKKDPLGLNEDGNLTDPAGTHTHSGQTRQAAMEEGLSPADVKHAVFGSWVQDNGPNVAWFPPATNGSHHALGPYRDDWLALNLAALSDDCSAQELGQVLHFVQDYVYHTDEDGDPYNLIEGHVLESAVARATKFAIGTPLAYDPDRPEGAEDWKRHFAAVAASRIAIRLWLHVCGNKNEQGEPREYERGGKPLPGPVTGDKKNTVTTPGGGVRRRRGDATGNRWRRRRHRTGVYTDPGSSSTGASSSGISTSPSTPSGDVTLPTVPTSTTTPSAGGPLDTVTPSTSPSTGTRTWTPNSDKVGSLAGRGDG